VTGMIGVLMAGITTASFSSLPEGNKLTLQVDSLVSLRNTFPVNGSHHSDLRRAWQQKS
jgi:hypothetical protein